MSAPLQSRQTPTGRTYVHPIDGYSVLSATNAGGIMDKPALNGWKVNQAIRFAVDIRERLPQMSGTEFAGAIRESIRGDTGARDRGSDVHAAVHDLITYGDIRSELTDDVLAHVQQFRRFEDDYQPRYIYAETTCYNPTFGYAGTLDLIAEINGELWVVDYKTGATGPWPESALQLSAYRHSEELVTGPPWQRHQMPETAGGAVLQLAPDKYTLVRMDTSLDTFKAFCLCVRLATFRNEHFDQLVGDPLTPKVTA